jgi:oxygen-independent coproporphyrinogen III oxidase
VAPPATSLAPARSDLGAHAPGAIGLYVHLPFCATKCPYCDFYSGVFAEERIPELVAMVGREAERTAAEPEVQAALAAHPVETLFLGGGTPSHLPAPALAALMRGLRAAFRFDPAAEITAECNPESLTSEKAAVLRDLGVNRVSVGVQSLDDDVLRTLGRPHDAAQALAAARLARATFPRVNFDLILAVPGHPRASLTATLDRLLALEPDHLSAYGLTLEPGTVFGARAARGELAPAPDDAYLAADAIVEAAAERAGLRRYEISNYARPGRECAHNLAIWRGGFYAGLGPSAASTLPGGPFGHRRTNVADLAAYVQKMRAGESPVATEELLDRRAAMTEALLLGLRLEEGVPLAHFAARFGTPLASLLAPALPPLIEADFLALGGDRLRVTRRGRPILDSILARLAGALDGAGA